MELIKNNKIIDFVKYSYFTFAISLLLIVGSICLIAFKGFSFGVDFSGGTLVQIQYTNDAPLAQIRSLLERDANFKGSQVSEFGSKQEILIKIPFSPNLKTSDVDAQISKLLEQSGTFEIRRVDSVGPKVGKELKEKGILALSLAMLAILAYVSFRYEWKFALAAVLALFHDVLISSACIILFKVDFNLEVVAALLTIIGYSINDTIIIFDRIREQVIGGKANDLKSVINDGLSSTLSRTLLTSLTVLFVVATLYVFGGEIIVGFSLPMLVGVVVGTYSSLFFAPRLIILFGFSLQDYRSKLLEKQKRAKEKQKMREMYENGRV
ncbi:protein translocase subunit SecF [Helicobacter kayseriensis]|uniref:protein translocase subunit SecF n=1 Tax=Helicobacter kayseriensis TaxID=2905877 RepID=UPI001E5F5B45|nr:protein translocase subunit SecF [Helicobacter kayseriensis]MCE3047090.1 protein translocase subunit SecF [Helicobacter kayseriensis]MCE3048250.1 protein translocase subunit SecF [Helicobacter kayseriensis]